MQNKIPCLVTFALLFSSNVFSQAAEKSNHPLLDKYYPQANKDTTKAVPMPGQVTGIKSNTGVTDQSVINKSTNATVKASEIKPLPVVTDTTANDKLNNKTIPLSKTNLISEIKPVTAVTDTTLTKSNTTLQVTVQKAQARPPSTPYIDTRLGSSTPQYDTWEKNNNGAGSVTTSPK
ncbi:MAG: hypothetical protein ACRDE8_17705 [Ginsengibacter sp.]